MGTDLRPKNGPGFDEKVGVRAMKKWVSERFWGTFLAQLKASNLVLFWIASGAKDGLRGKAPTAKFHLVQHAFSHLYLHCVSHQVAESDKSPI